ncbi:MULTISPECIES: PAS domain S-box protein [Rhodococcus]|uniref:Possible histidine kinase n=1 Tax=Rhodococcus jostii (strain RHA1) TaxID=101510 RepID=Q0S2P2_RHOJR|nr:MULTISPECIES: PAS domain S-box protein [Rhodococcus]ABG98194.1 possible histidine kinase [Rhodococcus jostii RHA1]
MRQLDSDGFAALMESIPHAISVHDRERNLVFSNPACAALIGYDTAEFADLEHEQLFHPDDAELWGTMLARVLGTESTSATAHLRIRHREGHWIWVRVAASTFTAGAERLVALVLQDESDTIWGNPTAARQPIR